MFRPVWTEEIIEEARRNLLSSGGHAALKAFEENCRLVRNPIVDAANPGTVEMLSCTADKDRHVLAAAIQARSMGLVTDSVRDFDIDEATNGGVVGRRHP